jgi:hypothetical protein
MLGCGPLGRLRAPPPRRSRGPRLASGHGYWTPIGRCAAHDRRSSTSDRLRCPRGRWADPTTGHTVEVMTGRYDRSEFNTYGAEDDEELDSILDALERANEVSDPPPALPNLNLDR